jgi:hypothetical protein
MKALLTLTLGFALTACGGASGTDTTHWSCYDAARAAQAGGSPHRFNDAGSHICTKAELDAAGIAREVRPADQR